MLRLNLTLFGLLLATGVHSGAVEAPRAFLDDAVGHPVVVSLAFPEYPAGARLAAIEGVAVLDVRTDGERVWVALRRTGPPMLLEAAEENVKSWRFRPHKPTNFSVAFRFRLDPDSAAVQYSREAAQNPTVLFRLPAEVEVTARRMAVILRER